MRRVKFDPTALSGPQREWWDQWEARANEALVKARAEMAATGNAKLQQKIWADLKDWLIENVFGGKCAYCESRFVAVAYGDAEHYRPKGEVRHRGTIVQVNGANHSGYWWLAYDWRNLVPACQKCNSEAKGTEFPTAFGYHADSTLDPVALDSAEGPLLLHPYYSEPKECLLFGDLGAVVPRNGDRRGEETIRVCRLDREALKTERHAAQENGWRQFRDLMAQQRTTEFVGWAIAQPHTSAVLAHVADMYNRCKLEFMSG
jgi:uncharacterized protein (TIGR02646 family)